MFPFIETIRIENGCIYNLPYHNERMNRTQRMIFHTSAILDLADYIHPEPYQERTKCRVEYADVIVKVEYAAYHIRPVSSLRVISCDTISYDLKSSDRSELNDLFAQRGEADDILIDRNGLLTDTSICNLALWNGSCWETPTSPLLCGTKRASLLDAEILKSADIRSVDLHRYSRIRLFNSMIEFGEIEFPVDNILL